MKLYLKQKIFSWKDKFTVFTESGEDRYYVSGEVLSLGKKLHLCDTHGRELAFIRQKLFTLLPKYHIIKDGDDVAQVVREFTLLKQKFTVHGLGWTVNGDILAHEYSVTDSDGGTVAAVSKKWLTLGDVYEIDIPGRDEIIPLSVVLVIDACLDSTNN